MRERTPPRDVGEIVFPESGEVKEFNVTSLSMDFRPAFVLVCFPRMYAPNPKAGLEAPPVSVELATDLEQTCSSQRGLYRPTCD